MTKMPARVYHVTRTENVASILEEGFLGGWGDAGFGVYVFIDLRSAENYLQKGGWDRQQDPSDMTILEIWADRSEFERVNAHSDWTDAEFYLCVLMVPLDEDSDAPWRPDRITALPQKEELLPKRMDVQRPYPSLMIPEVYHVGQFDETSRTDRSSLEAFMLSVSVNPDEWASIARCPGPVWTLTADGSRWLDYLSMSDEQEAWMIQWGENEGMISKVDIWRAWSFDDEFDGWVLRDYLSRAEAEAQVEGDIYDDTCPSMSGELVESREGYALSELAMERLERWHCPLDALDGLVILWTQDVLMPADPDLVGIWWDEELNPACLSCPRGGIFPERIHRFEIQNEKGEVPAGPIFQGALHASRHEISF